jgi:Fe-S-cluster containining protein
LLDRQVEAWRNGYALTGGSDQCHRGCSACCTLAVNCTFPEALAIAHELGDAGWSDVERHADQLLQTARASGSLKEYLQRKRLLGPCPFLDPDGACRIYAVRPLSCRALISTRESRWCGTDFSALSAAEKQAFLAGLDRRVADVPLHYAAFPRARGAEGEQRLLGVMAEQFGFAISGALPHLLRLERQHAMGGLAAWGPAAARDLLQRHDLLHPFLVELHPPSP